MSAARDPKRVPAELVGSPLDAVVRVLFETSWGEARRWIERGKIAVDGAPWTDARRRVGAGAEILFTPHAKRPRPSTDLPQGAIVHVDAHVIVVNKPAGISTVPYDESESGTLDERVRAALARLEPRGARGARPSLGVVHRIDKETSGLVVFTRTWVAKKSLASQFRAHTVHRRYLAIANGDVKSRTIRSRIVENRGDGLRGSRAKGDEGQIAITHVERIEELHGATLVACRLETGRTHQIRIHLSEAGHPIVGERVYVRGYEGDEIPAPRLMLHAAELGFVHPGSGREARWSVLPPADFEDTLTRLRA
jgi:23S rRNA pseudouridine1911/1915/1917 synthase